MKINEILKPKSQEDLYKCVDECLTYKFIDFIGKTKSKRKLKICQYLINVIGNGDLSDVYAIYSNNPLINFVLNDLYYYNDVVQRFNKTIHMYGTHAFFSDKNMYIVSKSKIYNKVKLK